MGMDEFGQTLEAQVQPPSQPNPAMPMGGDAQPQEKPLSLDEMFAQSQKESAAKVPSDVPNAGASPSVSGSNGISGSDAEGTNQPASLDEMFSQSQAESQKPLTTGRSGVQNYLGGVNGRIADALHGAYWAAKRVMEAGSGAIGLAASGELPTEENKRSSGMTVSNDAYQQSKDALKTWLHDKTGMMTQTDEGSLVGKMGSNTVDAMATLSTFFAAAPAMAAREGYSTADYLVRTFGKALQQHPWLAAVSEVAGGVPGSTVGEDVAGAPGAMAGGVIGQVALTPVQSAAKAGAKAVTGLAKRAVEAVDSIAQAVGGKGVGQGIKDALGIAPEATSVPTHIVDTYRAAESKARAAGEAVVQMGASYREVKDTLALPDKVAMAKQLLALRQQEKAAGLEAERAWQAIPAQVRGRYTQESEAIRSEFADPVYPKQFAEEQLAGDRKIVEDRITSSLNQVRASENIPAEEYSARISKGVNEAYDLATKIERRYWNRVDILNEPMPSRAGPLGDLDLYVNETLSRNSKVDIPLDAVARMRGLFASQGGSAGVFQKLPTVTKLRGELTAIDTERRTALAADSPNNRLIANLTKLEALGNKWITEAFPNNVPLQQARGFSDLKHDIFTRSELFPFLRSGARGQDRVRPEDALTRLMQRPHALDDLYHATDTLLSAKRIPKQGDAYPTALSFKQQAPLDQLNSDVENGIRQTFKQEVQEAMGQSAQLNGTMDPAKVALEAERIVTKWQPRIQAFSKAAGELQTTMDEALKGVAARRQIERSAMVKYFESNDATAAVSKVWSSPNAAKMARALISGEAGVGGFAKDPVALEGFRAALVDKLLDAGKMDPQRVKDLLTDGRINRLLSTALGADRMDRLDRIVSTSIEMDRLGQHSTFAQNVIWASRWAAVKFSAMLPRMGKGGELQQAALFSEIAKRKVMQMMAGGDPVQLMTEAIRNPSVERLLFSKIPKDTAELKEAMTTTRRILRMEVGLRGAMDAAMSNEDGPKPNPKRPDLSDNTQVQQALQFAQTGNVTTLPASTPGNDVVFDPFNNTNQGKTQDRAPSGNLPGIGTKPPAMPGKRLSAAPQSWREASATPRIQSPKEDYNDGVTALTHQMRHQRQNPALRPASDRGAPIDPGRDYIPSNNGLDHPWNIRT